MALFIQNTLTGKKEEFKPQVKGKVKMYVCGITPYDESHIGHARCYIVFDVIRRYLEYKKYEVEYIQNFTDIDDKIIKRSKELGMEPEELAEKYIKKYFDVMAKLNVKEAGEYPRVSKHIKDIIDTVSGLIEKGYAYEVDGSIYFSVESFKPYGKLSHRKKEDMVAGARVAVDEKKKNPLDFALWKKAKPEEKAWESPWGMGRPGWHIECSVMSTKYLGDTLDIHGGGRDLIFPHHENEIAQSEAASGKEFCKYWIHNGFVTINEEKMSKSLGNTFTLSDILEKYDPMVLRYFLLTQHYRSPVDFSDGKLAEAKKSLQKMKNAINDIKYKAPRMALLSEGTKPAKKVIIKAEDKAKFDQSISNTEKDFKAAMDDDFNTAKAIGHIFKLVKYLNTEINKEKQPLRDVLLYGVERVEELLGVLGIDLKAIPESDVIDEIDEVDELIKQREKARKNKDWKKSDEIRDKLKEMGIIIEDTQHGTRWKRG